MTFRTTTNVVRKDGSSEIIPKGCGLNVNTDTHQKDILTRGQRVSVCGEFGREVMGGMGI